MASRLYFALKQLVSKLFESIDRLIPGTKRYKREYLKKIIKRAEIGLWLFKSITSINKDIKILRQVRHFENKIAIFDALEDEVKTYIWYSVFIITALLSISSYYYISNTNKYIISCMVQ